MSPPVAAAPQLAGWLFDFGGTLAYEADAAGLTRARLDAVTRIMATERGTPTDDWAFAEHVHAAWRRAEIGLQRREWAGQTSSAGGFAVDFVAAAVGPASPSLVELVRDAIIEPPGRPQQLQPTLGCLELLRYLTAAGHRCGVLSNTGLSSGAYNRRWLRRTGLGELLHREAVCFSDETGYGKPDPRAYRLACERLGLAPWDVVLVGDDAWFDVAGGRGANLLTVWVGRYSGRRGPPPEADWVAEDLAEVLTRLRGGADVTRAHGIKRPAMLSSSRLSGRPRAETKPVPFAADS